MTSRVVGSGVLLADWVRGPRRQMRSVFSCPNTRRIEKSLGRQRSNTSELRDQRIAGAENTSDLTLSRDMTGEAGAFLRAWMARENISARSLVLLNSLRIFESDVRIAYGFWANVKDEPRRDLAQSMRSMICDKSRRWLWRLVRHFWRYGRDTDATLNNLR